MAYLATKPAPSIDVAPTIVPDHMIPASKTASPNDGVYVQYAAPLDATDALIRPSGTRDKESYDVIAEDDPRRTQDRLDGGLPASRKDGKASDQVVPVTATGLEQRS